MKICFNVSAMESGGAERVVSTLSNELVKKGHNVSIVMVSAIECRSYYKLDSKVELIALCEGFKSTPNPIKRVQILKKRLLMQKPDVVIAFLPHICVYTWLACKDIDVPYILSERNDPNTYSLIYKILIRKAFEAASGCVFQTHDAMEWYRKEKKFSDRIIFNSVGLTYIPTIGSNKEKKKSVLFVGRFDAQKNYEMLLKSFKKFLIDYPEYILDVYGDGPERENFFSILHELKLNNHVCYHGKSNTWHRDEFSAGLYVSTSDFEGMSNSLEEAAALGIPCVATDCPIGGSAELAKIFDNILLCKVKDENSFVQKMKEAVSIPCYFNGVNSKISREVIVNEWLNLINDIRRK